jgi:predicted helicase
MEDLQKLLYKIFLKSPNNLFDDFILECQLFYDKPAHNLLELKQRKNTKIKGDIFEEFCVLYLLNIKKYNNVWLLKNVPEDILNNLHLQRQDMGIDIIVEHNNEFYAVQCKYKKSTSTKNILSWQQLSTFYALCLKTGPYNKYIIMTNCDYTRHQGEKTNKDLSFCLKTFQNITKDEWLSMCKIECLQINIDNDENPTLEQLRELRLKYYENK